MQVARLALRAPRSVVAVALLIMVGAAVFGIPVIRDLSAGGLQDPNSQSWRASQILSREFDRGDMQLIVAVTAEDGVNSSTARDVGTDLTAQLQRLPFIASVTSAWTAPAATAPALISEDGKTGLIVAGITGGEQGAQQNAKELAGLLHDRPGVSVKAGGEVMAHVQASEQSQQDLLRMEAIAFPLSFVALVWVFGGLLSAALPLAVGCFAIIGSLAVLRAITFFTDVSVFALNVTLAMGLALAIDYTLLIVSRYRDEVAAGRPRDDALVRTMATAGRTVLFSAMTVALAMASMVLFPMYFLKSFAYAGIAVVALAAAAAVVVTPAVIVLLGDRVLRTWRGRPQAAAQPAETTVWYRSAKAVMRHSVPLTVAVIALLVTLGIPFAGVNWGFSDERVLPDTQSARQVGDELRGGFATDVLTDVVVVLPDAAGLAPADLDRYAAALSDVLDVSFVSAPGGTFRNGLLVGLPSAATGLTAESAFMTVGSVAPLYSPASEAQLDRLHAVAAPGGHQALMAGNAQINRDSSHAVTSRLPLVLSIIAVITVVLLFLLTGSVVLPLKALLLNVLSLSASFGALVWIFQDGHLGGFGTTATGALLASIPVLLFCVSFGLSMDYEVFLVSRIREYWLASDRTRAANDEAVAMGVARTGRVVTAAALLMVVSFAALTSAQVSFMRMFGVGLVLAVVVDATLVRMVLVPAIMHMLGRWSWWAPRPLARLHERIGISESDESSELPEPVTVRN
jgi:RND superfamily putative drug exporter